MSDEHTQDGAEPSPASAGSRPVAWAVMLGNRIYDHYDTDGEATAVCLWLRDFESNGKWITVPLYSHPLPMLTDEEREAIALAKSRLGTSDGDWQADDVLAALLQRLG
jgi:hypothetical protein